MATDTAEDGFGQVDRLTGIVFKNITRAAAAVGVVVLALLLVYTSLDAFQPFTADLEWYLVLLGTFVVPSLAVVEYCRRAGALGTASQAVGAVLAGTTLAALFVLWLGDQLGLAVLVAGVAPTVALIGYLLDQRQGLTVGLQTVGIAAAGGGSASMIAFFLGGQGALVTAVAVGVPAALLARFFLSRPAAGSVGVRAIGAAAAGATVGALTVGLAGMLGATLDENSVAITALASVLGVGAYAAYAYSNDRHGLVGLFAPFVLLAGALAGYLFHRDFVIVEGVTPLLYGVTAALPALAFAVHVVRTYDEGRIGLALAVVPPLGVALGVLFHREFVVLGPTVVATFAIAVGGALVAYAWYARRRGRSLLGLAVPVVAGGGLLAGLAGADRLGIAGPETWLTVEFLTRGSHYEPELTGLHPALIGSLYLMFVVTFVAFPLGVGAAIYLEEYAPDNRFARLLEINIANLAGVPSVVYGLLGVAVFIRFGGLSLGAVVAGGFTLSLLILPIVIVSAQEAIRAVPDSLRRASYGMGATRWQTVRNVVLPRALPGILTGTILALGRAVGETAPLIMVGLAPIGGIPNTLTDQGTALPMQVFSWASDARPLFRENVAAAGSMTLLVVLLAMNAVAIIIRNKYQRDQ